MYRVSTPSRRPRAGDVPSRRDQRLRPAGRQARQARCEVEELRSLEPCSEELVDDEFAAKLALRELGFHLDDVRLGMRGEPSGNGAIFLRLLHAHLIQTVCSHLP